MKNLSKWSVRSMLLAAALPAVPASGALINRYSFNGNANDSVGTAHGTLVNGATVSGGQLVLANSGTSNDVTTGQYVDLPNGIAPKGSFTIEGFATWNGGGDWQRIFDFGTNNQGEQAPGSTATGYDGTDYYFVTPRSGNDAGNQRLNNYNGELRVGGASNFVNGRNAAAAPFDYDDAGAGQHHFALAFSNESDRLSLYYDGRLVAQNTAAALNPATINDVNNWIGRSNWQGDPFFAGNINEFRIYNNELTPDEIAASAAAGPDTIVPEPGAAAFLGAGALALLRRRRKPN